MRQGHDSMRHFRIFNFFDSAKLLGTKEQMAIFQWGNTMQSRLLKNTCTGLVFYFVLGGSTAYADGITSDTKKMDAQTAGTNNDSLTYHNITLYGTIDAGVSHQTHGVPFNSNAGSGLEYLIAKNSNKSITAFAPNGLSQSSVGLKGDLELVDGLSGIFKLETGFDPLSLRVADGPASLVDNNGRSLNTQTSNGDSSRAGQTFNGAAYVGVKSKDYGILTFGRQNGLLADNVFKYDPNGGSNAFSLIGYSGATGGVGDTQDVRLDSSLKYTNQMGPFRMGAQYQFSGTQRALFRADGISGSAVEINLGGDYGKFSADVTYSHKNNAISAAPLSAVQLLTLPSNSLAATVSDNTSYAIMGKYTINLAKIYAGYERIQFSNPSNPLSVGTTDIGGYMLSALTQNAYDTNRILQVYWAGLKYSMTSQLNLTGAYYGYNQNSFAAIGCSDTSNSKCSGTLNAASLVATYNVMQHLDIYSGIMWSGVHNGLASGYLQNNTVSTMVGARFTF